MANVLEVEKQVAVISGLVEGASVRSIERMTGVHRDTILRLMVRVAGACAEYSDTALRDLPCGRIECDEIWAYVAKKQRNVRADEDRRQVGDQYTFVALDADSKLIPCWRVGKRGAQTAVDFMLDLKSRLRNRVQLSTDGFEPYVAAVRHAFGDDVDYAQDRKSTCLNSSHEWNSYAVFCLKKKKRWREAGPRSLQRVRRTDTVAWEVQE